MSFAKGDRLLCIKDSHFSYGPDVRKGEEYVSDGMKDQDRVMIAGTGGYSFFKDHFTLFDPNRKMKRMILKTSTFQIADVPVEETQDPDANWESWNWQPLDKRPEHFIYPSRE